MTQLARLWRELAGETVREVIRPGRMEPDASAHPWPVTAYLRLAAKRLLRLDQVTGEVRVSARLVTAVTVPVELADEVFTLIPVGDLLPTSKPAVVTGLRGMVDEGGRMACLEFGLAGGALLVDPWSFDGLELSRGDLETWQRRMHAENLAGLRLRSAREAV